MANGFKGFRVFKGQRGHGLSGGGFGLWGLGFGISYEGPGALG